jgi:hypothetical protein
MDRDKARQTLTQLRKDQLAATDTVRDLIRQMEARSKVIEGYEELYPELAENEDDSYEGTDDEQEEWPLVPRGQEAVRRLLSERPAQWWTIDEVVSEMYERGWLPGGKNPTAAVRAALGRLTDDPLSGVDKGRAKDGRRVYWRYQPPSLQASGDFEEEPFG